MFAEIPILDSRKDSRKDFVQKTGQAFEHVGCSYIRTPDVPALLPPFFDSSRKTFHLPEEKKRKYERPKIGWQRGWAPLGTEEAIFCRIRGQREHRSDTRNNYEWWFIGQDIDPNHPLALEFPEAYPPNVWPEEVPEFKEAMTNLYNALYPYGMDVLSAIGEYLGKPAGYFEGMALTSPTVMRALYYPSGVMPPLACQHTDINFITVLPPSTKSWLYVKPRWARTDDEVWIHVQSPEPDLSLVQVGDMLEHVTAGQFLSADHKVEAPSYPTTEKRFSAALFLHARSNVVFRPEGPRTDTYWQTTAGERLRSRLVEIGVLKA